MSNEKNWCLLRLLLLIRFCLFFVLLFYFFAIVSFVTTTPDKLQFQSQVRLYQINVVIPIRLKFKLYAFCIGWGGRTKFLFVGNYRQLLGIALQDFQDLPQKVGTELCSTCYMKKIVKMSFPDQLVCFAGFVVMNVLALFFLLPLPSCFLSVCLPTLFAAVLKFFLPVTTSVISGLTNSSNSAPTRFAAGTTYICKNGFAVLAITCASATNPHPCCRPICL